MTKKNKIKTLLITLNAKYIHTSLALRWLYVANKDKFDISFREYTIKENLEKIVSDIKSLEIDVLGIGVYIWNVEQTKLLVQILKEELPNLKIILGGPEVSYEPDFFLENWKVDFVVSGEGEFVLGKLLQAIQNWEVVNIESVSTRKNISNIVAQADLEELIKLSSPYQLDEDRADLNHRMIYFETSRGCPYSCAYCLSSLELGVRYFEMNFIEENLIYLINSDAKRIKFLDRTFNIRKKHTLSIYEILLKNYRENLSCQFEIYADILDSSTIEFLNEKLPHNFFRFEIGIQSTHEPTNLAVNRKQDFEKLSENIRLLMQGGKVDLHLDLIAGLPFENYDRFVKSFDDVFQLRAKELELGFLKMLRGTALRRNSEKYNYIFSETAPYEVVSNDFISENELNRIRDAEFILDKFWNSGRFSQTMNYIFDNEFSGKYFQFFELFGEFYKENKFPNRAYQLEDLFRYLNSFLLTQNIDANNTLREDYYSNFASRPRGYWTDNIDTKTRKKLLNKISQDEGFLFENTISQYQVLKQATIDLLEGNRYLITIFNEEEKTRIKVVWEGEL